MTNIHPAYVQTYWAASDESSACKSPEIVRSRNWFARHLALEPWEVPKSWVSGDIDKDEWVRNMMQTLDHMEWYRGWDRLDERLYILLWHTYDMRRSSHVFWTYTGFTCLYKMYHPEAFSYGIAFCEKNHLKQFLQSVFFVWQHRQLPGPIQPPRNIGNRHTPPDPIGDIHV